MRNKVNTSSQTVRTCDVFISYRRDGGDMTAMYFFQALKERGYRVFYDLEVLRAGKFNEALLSSIESCKDFVLILSPHALDRCGDENDWVRKEIAEALRTNKNIVPVMLKGFSFPEALPDDIDDIRYQNGLTCTTEYFEESINRLCERYLKSLPEKAEKRRNPLVPVLAAIAVLAVAVGGFMAMRGRDTAAPAPEITSAIEVTAAPEITEAPTAAPDPTEAPTEEPAAEPVSAVVRDTDFPALIRGMDKVPGFTQGADDDALEAQQSYGPAFNHPDIQRRDVASVTFLPSLDGAPEDAIDVSEDNDGRVLAWFTEAEDGLYDLYIAGDGGVRILENDGPSPMFSCFTNLKFVNFNGCVDFTGRTDFSRLFWCCRSLEEIRFDGVYTGNAGSFSGMFGFCDALESLDLSGFDTARAETFDGMFLACKGLKSLDISGFDTSRCANMESMFAGCEALRALDVSNFDTSRVQQMEYMFSNCRSLETLDISAFDTARVTDMERMFAECQSLEALDLSGFDTSHVTNMKEMFFSCISLADLNVGSFNTERVIDMFGMFSDCESLLKLDVSGFDTSRAENMGCVFADCFLLDDLDLTHWNTGRVQHMGNMFASCNSMFKLDLRSFDTSNVILMENMFSLCRSMVEVNLEGWDVSNVESMKNMFSGCGNLETIGRDPAAFGHGDTEGMYDGCDKLTGKS